MERALGRWQDLRQVPRNRPAEMVCLSSDVPGCRPVGIQATILGLSVVFYGKLAVDVESQLPELAA